MRTIRFQLSVVTLILLGSLGTGTAVLGQPQASGNVLPPPFSPYMQLFRDDTLSLPAYYQYVRPELERRNLTERVETRIRALEGPAAAGGGTLRLPVASETEAGTSRSLRFRSTTTTTTPRRSAVHMDLMHYYPSARTPQARR